jgi:hypothetical protein
MRPSFRRRHCRNLVVHRILTFAYALGLTTGLAACSPDPAPITIRVIDATTGESTPSRLEVLNEAMEPQVATNAIPVTFECFLSPYASWLAPLQSDLSLFNPYTGTRQFYADGNAELLLAPGTYRVRVAKGLEWRREERTLEVKAGESQDLRIELNRWADPSRERWYGTDDHIHVTRMHRDDNHRIARWMRAEGLSIANLLEMGTAAQLSVTPQYAYGDEGAYRDGPLLLLTGEEHPRTHFLGHTITLGTESRVDERAEYIVYESTFAEGARLGGVSGFAHWGMRRAHDGLAIVAPTGLVRFVEVLQFEFPYYDVWYQLLNLGFRIAPTAGTDFPCGPPSLPGRERFYAQIDGEVTRESFVKAVRAGRTFVTNGPMVELLVDGRGPGEEIVLDAPGKVTLLGRIRFDPAQDRVDRVEVIVNGEVVATQLEATAAGLFEIQHSQVVEHAAWIALRSFGTKPADDGPMLPKTPEWALDLVGNIADGAAGPELIEFRDAMTERTSASHSAAVFINVAGSSRASSAGDLPRAWLDRLSDLEARLSDDQIDQIPIMDWISYSDGVSEAHLRENRAALLEAIGRARTFYEAIEREGQ